MVTEQLSFARAQSEYDDLKKSPGVAYAFWFFFGLLGGHRFYLGDTGLGIAMLCTLGGLGVWALIDVFLIGGRIREVNSALKQEVFARHGLAP